MLSNIEVREFSFFCFGVCEEKKVGNHWNTPLRLTHSRNHESQTEINYGHSQVQQTVKWNWQKLQCYFLLLQLYNSRSRPSEATDSIRLRHFAFNKNWNVMKTKNDRFYIASEFLINFCYNVIWKQPFVEITFLWTITY